MTDKPGQRPLAMTSSRPYLVRALYEWIVDNGATPHLLVEAGAEGVQVPEQHVKDGKIVLNVDPAAVQGLQLGNDWVCFSARFGGRARNITVPIGAVLAIYARENGQGMMFGDGNDPQPPVDPSPLKPPKRAGLRVVK